MSTRWYPLYQKGNPQLRVFLPNFWMKLVKSENNQPKNIVEFHCSMEMTRLDIKNYLEKIYDVHPVAVQVRIALGKTHEARRYVYKDDDVKIAYVILPKNESFTFPEIGSAKDQNVDQNVDQDKQIDALRENFKNFTSKNKLPGFPTWFRT